MSTLNVSNFIWGIADDVLREIYVREKFLDPSVNLSPRPVLNADESVCLEGLDNHDIQSVQLPIPPVPEQTAIVERVD